MDNLVRSLIEETLKKNVSIERLASELADLQVWMQENLYIFPEKFFEILENTKRQLRPTAV